MATAFSKFESKLPEEEEESNVYLRVDLEGAGENLRGGAARSVSAVTGDL